METKKIHIGELVESAFNKSNLIKSEFAEAIGVHAQNLNKLFKNEDWSVIKLIRAGRSLNYDFSPLFMLEEISREIQKPKVLLQIEVEEEKVNEVLKIIQDKDLYNILKR